MKKKYLVTPPVPQPAIPEACDQLQDQGFSIIGIVFIGLMPVKRSIQLSPKPEVIPHFTIFICIDSEVFESGNKKISLDLHL